MLLRDARLILSFHEDLLSRVLVLLMVSLVDEIRVISFQIRLVFYLLRKLVAFLVKTTIVFLHFRNLLC